MGSAISSRWATRTKYSSGCNIWKPTPWIAGREPEELEAIAIESKRVIDIDEFVAKKEIDQLYLNNPYYLVPDGEVGQQAFAVIREAIRKEGMVALAKVVFTSREHVIAFEPRDKGMLGITLRYPYEVRNEKDSGT